MPNDWQNQATAIQPEPLTVRDRFWLDAARHTEESVGALENAAKQLSAITSLSQGIYFAIAFGDLKKALPPFRPAQQWAITGALVLPLVCRSSST